MKRDAVLRVRVPKEDLTRWEGLASEAGVKFSEWVVSKLDGKVTGSLPKAPKDIAAGLNKQLGKGVLKTGDKVAEKPKKGSAKLDSKGRRYTGESGGVNGKTAYEVVDGNGRAHWTFIAPPE